jgi:ribosome-associated protein
MGTTAVLQPVDYARIAVDVASDKQASDIVMLDLRGVSDFTDYFVIVTGESRRQLSSLIEDIEKALEEQGARLHHREGTAQGGWMLLDFGDVVIHLFGPEDREYYRLEDVWEKGVETVRIQ